MSNISDSIEEFILKTLGNDDTIEISRNDLATFFSVAPSQINYVLDTRFTIDRGFLRESKRGGGGSIKLIRVSVDDGNFINEVIIESVGDELSYKRAVQILDRLLDEDIISVREFKLIKSAISDEALLIPTFSKEKCRANIFKNILLTLLKEKK